MRLGNFSTVAGDPRTSRASSSSQAGGQAGFSAMALAPNLEEAEMHETKVILARKHAVTDPETGDLYWVLDVPPMPRLESLEWSFTL